jgi:hypothetical protein
MAFSVDSYTYQVQNLPGRTGETRRTETASRTAQAEERQKDANPYRVTISEEALRKAGLLKDETEKSANTEKPGASDKDTQEVAELKQADQEVRAHEQAHVMAGGNLVRGGATFGYKRGPDGNLYAVSGEVSIDSSPVQGDPRATIRKAEQVRKAALAPAQPSSQDRAVAAAASGMEVQAQAELNQEQFDKVKSSSGQTSPQAGENAGAVTKSTPESKVSAAYRQADQSIESKAAQPANSSAGSRQQQTKPLSVWA